MKLIHGGPIIQLFFVMTLFWQGVCMATDSKAFFNDHARGWFWYEDPDFLDEEFEPKKGPQPSDPTLTQEPKLKTAVERLKEVQAQLAELKAKAILEPTRANVKVYQEKQMAVMNQSQAFSDAWLMNVYLNPSLDENVKNPRAQGARFVVYEEERNKNRHLIESLKDRYGLFYFYSGSCAYCKAFAPILKQFADKYGWDVMAISLDRTPSELFSHWQPDNGIADRWNVETIPAVFAINPETNHVIPIANGFTAIDAMEQRVVTLVKGGEQ